jgi:hypothetical protein
MGGGMRRSLVLCALALAACGPRPYRDISGPFTGTTHRFVLDRFEVPGQRSDFADDLNGDGRPDDQFGNVAGALAGEMDLASRAAVDDMLASGVFAPVVEITSDDPTLRNDPTVGVRFIGKDGEIADEMGGSLANGVLITNPTRLVRVPASATLHVPLFRHADPLVLPAVGLELEIGADGDGFSGTLHGALPSPTYLMPAWISLTQMVTANPQEFPLLFGWLDANGDGLITFDEFTQAGIVKNITAPDVQLTDGHGGWAPSPDNGAKDSLSFGFAIHLVPCAAGTCHAPPSSTCDDRVLDGDETDVDCGGACIACGSGARCRADGDCQTRHCDGGVCAAPTCSDGVRDGAETGVDCGAGCGPCPSGDQCRRDADCTSGYCADAFLALGKCTELLCHDGVRDNDESDVDCGGHCAHCARGQVCNGNSDCASGDCNISCSGTACVGTCR